MHRFNCSTWSFVAACLMLTIFASPAMSQQSNTGSLWVYIGTYNNAKSKGIYLSRLDLSSGTLTTPELVAEATNPSFLTIAPSRKFLYAVGEIANFDGKKTGAVSAYAIDAKSGKLTLLNQQSSQGAGPCHVSIDRDGKNVLVANYGGGSIASLPVDADGKLRPASAAVQHKGSGTIKPRQAEPHAHSINLDASNKFAFAADLGLDKVLVYRFDGSKGSLTENDPPAASVAGGAGPRHFAFHPSGKFAYVINEISLTVTGFRYDADRGVLTEIETLSTMPAGTTDTKGFSTAEVQVHPSGKFLYGSNRGHNTLAIFAIDPATGKLTAAGHQSTGGKTPRNFGIDPTGAYILAANQGSDSVVVFRVNQSNGSLQPTGQTVEVGAPVCIKYMTPPQ